MKRGAERVLEEFERFLAGRGLRLTVQRRIVLDAALATRQHMTVDDLADRMRSKETRIARATLYRTVQLLCEAGLMLAHDFGQGIQRYEFVRGHEHHDHMRCTKCGRIIEFHCDEIERLQEEMARKKQFTMSSHRLEIFGLCESCA